MSYLITNATLIQGNGSTEQDIYINKGKIERIEKNLQHKTATEVIDATGLLLLPGMIDDQVHFREPGLTHKGTIASESAAAVAGGITSFMEMPNVNPPTLTLDALEHKYNIAKKNACANYSFYLGTSHNNLDEVKKLNPNDTCGIKIFMGASTGNLLVDDLNSLERLFRDSPVLIATHCEDDPTIRSNMEKYQQQYGDQLTMAHHPLIRSKEACLKSSTLAVGLARKYGSDLHVLHITTQDELALFSQGSIESKKITAEACVHHLWFNSDNHQEKGTFIKCNPAIKSESDRQALLQAVRDNVIDIIATDHAPHTLAEKQQLFVNAPAGLPLVESALLSLFDQVKRGEFTLEQLVQKTAHNPALRYQIKERGFIKEGYYADLVLVNPNKPTPVNTASVRAHCGWSPFSGHTFSASIVSTFVNGKRVFDGQHVFKETAISAAQKLAFTRT